MSAAGSDHIVALAGIAGAVGGYLNRFLEARGLGQAGQEKLERGRCGLR